MISSQTFFEFKQISCKLKRQDKSERTFSHNSKYNIIVNILPDADKTIISLLNDCVMGKPINLSDSEISLLFRQRDIFANSNIYEQMIQNIDAKCQAVYQTWTISPHTLSNYLQIYNDFHKFFTELRKIMKYIIPVKNAYWRNDIDILENYLFYHIIQNGYKTVINNMIDIPFTESQLPDYLSFINIMQKFFGLSSFIKNISNVIGTSPKLLFDNLIVVNSHMKHLNDLILSIAGKNINYSKIMNKKYFNVDMAERITIKKIYNLSKYLHKYAPVKYFIECYCKFLQARIVIRNYDLLELEIELVLKMKNNNKNANIFQKIIDDILFSRNLSTSISSSVINIITPEYQNIDYHGVEINPVVINNKTWKIPSLPKLITSNKQINFYNTIIQQIFNKLISDQLKFISWCCAGEAIIDAKFNDNVVTITCHILQAISLLYFNENSQCDIKSLANYLGIKLLLAKYVMKSLYAADLLVKISPQTYIVNMDYNGDTRIDIQAKLVKQFEIILSVM